MDRSERPAADREHVAGELSACGRRISQLGMGAVVGKPCPDGTVVYVWNERVLYRGRSPLFALAVLRGVEVVLQEVIQR